MADESLYLFDGYNLLHASPYSDRRELVDALASFVAMKGARGILVFDGEGDDVELGPLSVRYAPDADALIERLAAEHRERERVAVVTSDAAILGTAGRRVARISSAGFFRDLEAPAVPGEAPAGLSGRLDAETLARLERLRRGE